MTIVEEENVDIAGTTSRLSDERNGHFSPSRRDPFGTETGQNQACRVYKAFLIFYEPIPGGEKAEYLARNEGKLIKRNPKSFILPVDGVSADIGLKYTFDRVRISQ